MSNISVVLRDPTGSTSAREVPAGTRAAELLGAGGGTRELVAARVAGQLRDLSHVLADGDEVEDVRIDSPDGLSILRHSTAHVLAQAVQSLRPDARLGIGPPIENGFYYDFGVETTFAPDDLAAIKERMKAIVKQGQ